MGRAKIRRPITLPGAGLALLFALFAISARADLPAGSAPASYAFVATLSGRSSLGGPDGDWSLASGSFDVGADGILSGTLTARSPSGEETSYRLSGTAAGRSFVLTADGSQISATGEITSAGIVTGEISDNAAAGKHPEILRSGALSGASVTGSSVYLGAVDGDSAGVIGVVIAADGTLHGVFGGPRQSVPVFGEPANIAHTGGSTGYLWRARTGDGFAGTIEATLNDDSALLAGTWITLAPGLRRGTWSAARVPNGN